MPNRTYPAPTNCHTFSVLVVARCRSLIAYASKCSCCSFLAIAVRIRLVEMSNSVWLTHGILLWESALNFSLVDCFIIFLCERYSNTLCVCIFTSSLFYKPGRARYIRGWRETRFSKLFLLFIYRFGTSIDYYQGRLLFTGVWKSIKMRKKRIFSKNNIKKLNYWL